MTHRLNTSDSLRRSRASRAPPPLAARGSPPERTPDRAADPPYAARHGSRHRPRRRASPLERANQRCTDPPTGTCRRKRTPSFPREELRTAAPRTPSAHAASRAPRFEHERSSPVGSQWGQDRIAHRNLLGTDGWPGPSLPGAGSVTCASAAKRAAIRSTARSVRRQAKPGHPPGPRSRARATVLSDRQSPACDPNMNRRAASLTRAQRLWCARSPRGLPLLPAARARSSCHVRRAVGRV